MGSKMRGSVGEVLMYHSRAAVRVEKREVQFDKCRMAQQGVYVPLVIQLIWTSEPRKS